MFKRIHQLLCTHRKEIIAMLSDGRLGLLCVRCRRLRPHPWANRADNERVTRCIADDCTLRSVFAQVSRQHAQVAKFADELMDHPDVVDKLVKSCAATVSVNPDEPHFGIAIIFAMGYVTSCAFNHELPEPHASAKPN